MSTAVPRRRILLGAFGDAGHAFPVLALGRHLAERGHEVCVETWLRWKDDVEAAGLRFSPAPEFPVFPELGRWLSPYEAAQRAALETLAVIDDFAPDVVVADILTLGPALAAELRGIPVATLIPHIDPRTEPDWPPFASSARLARTPLGRAGWRRMGRLVDRALEHGRVELNDVRTAIGLPPLAHAHGGISPDLVLVGSVPQLAYPRPTPLPNTHVVGPFVWQPPADDVPLPAGEDPLVLVAPSTKQDPEGTLLRAALHGLADAPVRVLAAQNRVSAEDAARLGPIEVPDNALLVPWVSYGQTMPLADVVVCHAGHGTLLRALAVGKPVVAIPATGDMHENAARLAWSGAGIRLPRRLAGPRAMRTAVLTAITDPSYAARAAEIAAWVAAGDGPQRAAPLVEALAARGPQARPVAASGGTGAGGR